MIIDLWNRDDEQARYLSLASLLARPQGATPSEIRQWTDAAGLYITQIHALQSVESLFKVSVAWGYEHKRRERILFINARQPLTIS